MGRIAIIGVAGLFPGAPDVATFWRNIVDGVDAISDVPTERWDPQHYDPDSRAVDRFYCRRGGFVDAHATFDPLRYGIVPNTAEAIEPDQLLTLKIGHDALADAGYDRRPFPRERSGVIVGRGNYVGAGVLRLEQHVRLLPQLLRTLRDLFPALPDDALETARQRLAEQLTPYGPDAAAGLIPNLTASRLANRLDLRGPAYTVDAACASALVAVEQACAALLRGDADLMLAGAAHLSHDLTFWATFCQLGALSRSGTIRPLAADADGILAGEGVGMTVLKRLDDALADGDRIYAVIEGCASSSDGRSGSVIAPSAAGQQLALQRAWSLLTFERGDIGLLEAHGTGTPTGDSVELDTVAAFFGPAEGDAPRPVIGSVKSMIGHAMPASGMAGLIKTALAIHHGVLPPTLHCENPHPRLTQTRFRVIGRAESWQQPREARIAALNTFGFGGINAHAVLRGVSRQPAMSRTTTTKPMPTLPAVLRLAAATPTELLQQLDGCAPYPLPEAGAGPCRLLIIEPDARRLATARKIVAAGKPWSGRQQIWFSPHGLIAAGGRVAFLFAGVDSRFEPRTDGLAETFGVAPPAHCQPLDPAQSLSRVVVGLLGLNRYLFDRLAELGIHADVMAGHSVGEWSAMLCSGMMSQALSDDTNARLDLDAVAFPDAQFLAAACSVDTLQTAMADLVDIALSHDNCPHQVIACGVGSSVQTLEARLREAGVMTQRLKFVSGFHSPMFAGHMGWYREFFGKAELCAPQRPLWSATTVAPFPATPAARRQLALDHLLQPVRFRQLIEALYSEGCRVFVEVGSGSLAGFVDDTLSGRPHLALRSNRPDRGGLQQLQQLCAALWVEGLRFDTRLLQVDANADVNADADGAPTLTAPTGLTQAPAPSGGMQLRLGVPLLRIDTPLPQSLIAPASPVTAGALTDIGGDDALSRLVRDTLGDIDRASREVAALWQRHRNGGSIVTSGLPRRVTRLLDLNRSITCVNDHALYPQRPGWPIVADRHPVVPMTMEVMLMREALEEALPHLKVVEVSHIEAYNWLAVSRQLTVEITLDLLDSHCVRAEIVGYCRARLHLAADYPPPPAIRFEPLRGPRATTVEAKDLYREGWMFHGPAYQGVQAFEGIGENGIDGRLRVPTGKGALLDNMGQLAGYWVMEQPDNCLAMPIGVDRIRFYAPDPTPGKTLQAQVRIRELDPLNCVSDHQLYDADGALRVAMDGWRTRRYQMDKRFWQASRRLSRHGVSRAIPGDITVFDDRYDTAILRDYLARRYLTTAERAAYEQLQPRRRRQWLAGRVAAKDAIGNYLRRAHRLQDVYPQEMRIDNAADGAPYVVANVTDTVPETLHLSIAHKGRLAAAIVGLQPVGIDLEVVEPRDAGFAELAFSDAERILLDTEATDVAWTRGWVAKEVAAKVAGTGLRGQPRMFHISARDGDCLRVNDRWIVTHRLHDCIIGWSLPPAADAIASTAQPLNLSIV